MNESQSQHPVHRLGEPCSMCIAQTRHRIDLGLIPLDRILPKEKTMTGEEDGVNVKGYVRQHPYTQLGVEAVKSVEDLSNALDSAMEANEAVLKAHGVMQRERDNAQQDARNLRARYNELQGQLTMLEFNTGVEELRKTLNETLYTLDLAREEKGRMQYERDAALKANGTFLVDLGLVRNNLADVQMKYDFVRSDKDVWQTKAEKAEKDRDAILVTLHATEHRHMNVVEERDQWMKAADNVKNTLKSYQKNETVLVKRAEKAERDAADSQGALSVYVDALASTQKDYERTVKERDKLSLQYDNMVADRDRYAHTLSESQHNEKLLLDRAEQAEVQLAGCSVAARGGTEFPAKKGDWGWSQAYQDVLELRIRFEALQRLSTPKAVHGPDSVPATECYSASQEKAAPIAGVYIIQNPKPISTWEEDHRKDLIAAAESLLEWCPTCSANSSGALRQRRLRNAILAAMCPPGSGS